MNEKVNQVLNNPKYQILAKAKLFYLNLQEKNKCFFKT